MFGLDFLEAFADGFLTGVMSEWGRRRVVSLCAHLPAAHAGAGRGRLAEHWEADG